MRRATITVILALLLTCCGEDAAPPLATTAPAPRPLASPDETAALGAILDAIAEELGETHLAVVDATPREVDHGDMSFVRTRVARPSALRGGPIAGQLVDLLLAGIDEPRRFRREGTATPTTWIDGDAHWAWFGRSARRRDGGPRPGVPSTELAQRGAAGIALPSRVVLTDDGRTAVAYVSRLSFSDTFCGNCAGPEDVPTVAVARRESDAWTVTDLVALTFY